MAKFRGPYATVSSLTRHGLTHADVRCVRCGNRGHLPLADFLPETVFVAIKPKLVCSACGAKGIDLDMMPDWRPYQAPGRI
jgi:hypothetical protein